MRRARSHPALLTISDSQAYGGVLLPGDEWDQAERLYYGAISRKFCFREACVMAKALNRQNPDAGLYLRWLVERGQEIPWPKVKWH